MANTKLLKNRVRSVRSTRQITKAMELVSASKLRRVQEAARASRSYSQTVYSVLQRVASVKEVQGHRYFQRNETKKKLYIIFTSDRGLAGAFNANVNNATLKAVHQDTAEGIKTDIIAFGRRGARLFASIEEVNLLAAYEELPDVPDPAVFASLLDIINTTSESGEYRSVHLIYTEFISALTQSVKDVQLLPVEPPEEVAGSAWVYELEPSVEAVVERATQLYMQSLIMQAKVDSAASEHAMRMMAMSNASKNADDLVDDLTLELNATRQASITQEIAEITGGVEAIK